MVPVENGSVWPDFERAGFSGEKREFDSVGGQAAENFELHLVHCVFGMEES